MTYKLTFKAGAMTLRKSATSLTDTEIDKFVTAVTTLKNTPTTDRNGNPTNLYDQFVAIHPAVTRLQGFASVDGGHRNAAFLPWHREYLHRFEQALQMVDPDVLIPYWDWTDHVGSEFVLFQDNFIGPNGGLGGIGGGAVESGHFSLAEGGWRVDDDLNPLSPSGALVRNLGEFSDLATQSDVNSALNQSSYDLFRPALEAGNKLHNFGHVWTGGNMGNFFSPNDPLFWLHHANVDRLWAEWQANGHQGSNFYPASGQPNGHNLNDPMWPWDGGSSSTLFSSVEHLLPTFEPTDIVTPIDVLDIASIGYSYLVEPAIQGTSDVTFSDPPRVTSADSEYEITGNSISWGTPLLGNSNGARSSLSITEGSFSTRLNTPFEIGEITFFNGTIVTDTGLDGVDLLLDMTIDIPELGIDDFPIMAQRNIFINDTPNIGTPEQNADFLTIETDTSPGQENSLGNFKNSFHIFEGAEETASLIGRITQSDVGLAPFSPFSINQEALLDGLTLQSPQQRFKFELLGFGKVKGDGGFLTTTSVPEPTSTLSVLAFGALGASSALKRKQKQKSK
ncbi:tyrosinase family protein [Coleofasciculus sp.]|uniref:tyrosinase family protein n=1 Tax=Coleofasciculus sp. TaxID=3100458 RepID=UPI0039FA7F0A